MTKVPRASLCITILDDEDYRVLMASRGGLEAFGVFVAVLVVGRERLQQHQARQLSGTDSLRFDNSTTHILAMAHLTAKQLDRCLNAFAGVAAATGGEPWLSIDETKHLVIRSFFKFNTNSGWGGPRPGAGRHPQRNQDDSEINQVDSAEESSRFPSGSGTGSGTGSLLSLDAGEPAPNQLPFVPKDFPALAVVPSGKGSPEALALGEWARSLGTDRNRESYAFWGVSACEYAPASWVNVLLREKVSGRGQPPTIPVLNRILGDWLRDGSCPLLDRAAAGGARPAAKPAPTAEEKAKKHADQARRLREMENTTP